MHCIKFIEMMFTIYVSLSMITFYFILILISFTDQNQVFSPAQIRSFACNRDLFFEVLIFTDKAEGVSLYPVPKY